MSYDINKYLQFENNLRSSDNMEELLIFIVNQLGTFLPYEQAVIFGRNMNSKSKVEAISNVPSIDNTSPFIQFMNDLSDYLLNISDIDKTLLFTSNDLSEGLRGELVEFGPSYILFVPLSMTKNSIQISYHLMIFGHAEYSSKEIDLMNFLKPSISHSIFALRQCSINNFINKKYFTSKYITIGFVLLILVMIFPIRMSVLSPCEIVPKDPLVISSPIEGVIDSIEVQPNQIINKGDLLVKLEKLDLENNYLISLKKLKSVQAELLTTRQAGFYDLEKKSQIAQLQVQVELITAETDYAKSLLDKSEIFSDLKGIAILDNPDEWKGKPVVTGERLLIVANQKEVEIKIMLPVHDALFLENGSDVKLFMDNIIFRSWEAKVNRISFRPKLTAENIMSYNVVASFVSVENKELPKIGLRGTAKIYSDYVPIFYYLFHKPITWLRQVVGW